MFRTLRIALLLLVLVFVAANTWLDRVYSRDWDAPLYVALHPLNADGSNVTDTLMRAPDPQVLARLDTFFAEQAEQYALPLDRPLRFVWAPAMNQLPPLVPEGAGLLGIMGWSLKLRWYAWHAPDANGPTATIRMFLLYHDPASQSVLPHSTGLEKGMVGIAHLFASSDMQRANDVIIAHEVLHTLGATDKYDPDTNLPRFPDGYADAEQSPLYPQRKAELMAGRIAISDQQAEQAGSLRDVVIGAMTAREIGWTTAP